MGYKTAADAEFRLNGTIVSYDGRPVLVRQARDGENGPELQYRAVGASRNTWAPMNDPLFNRFKPIPLGFVNYYENGGQECSHSASFIEMVAGEYPTFDEALERLIPASSIAVSREFALRMTSIGSVILYYKRTQVGSVFRGQLYLSPGSQYLLESIIEEPNLPSNVEIL